MAVLPLVISSKDEMEQIYLLDFQLGRNHHDLAFFITCDQLADVLCALMQASFILLSSTHVFSIRPSLLIYGDLTFLYAPQLFDELLSIYFHYDGHLYYGHEVFLRVQQADLRAWVRFSFTVHDAPRFPFQLFHDVIIWVLSISSVINDVAAYDLLFFFIHALLNVFAQVSNHACYSNFSTLLLLHAYQLSKKESCFLNDLDLYNLGCI